MANLKGIPQQKGTKVTGYKMPKKSESPKPPFTEQMKPLTVQRKKRYYWEPKGK